MQKISIIILILSISFSGYSQSSLSTKDSLRSYVNQLIRKALKKKNFKKIAVWDFTERGSQTSDFGRYVSDQLSIYATDIDNISVLDRQNLGSIIKEHKLKDKEFLIDKNALIELRKFSGADVVLVGNVRIFEKSDFFQLNTVIVDVNTADRLAAKEDYIPADRRFIEVSGFVNDNSATKYSSKSPSIEGARLTASTSGTNTLNQISPPLKKTIESPCITSNTGDFCFVNQSKFSLIISVERRPFTNSLITDPVNVDELSIIPGETKCIYNYTAGNVHRFRAQLMDPKDYKNGQRAGYYWSTSSYRRDLVDQGMIRIERCNSIVYKITSNSVITGED